MLGSHSLVSVGKEHHEARLTDPLGLTRGDELIDDALGGVGEVTELGLEKTRTYYTFFTIQSRYLVLQIFTPSSVFNGKRYLGEKLTSQMTRELGSTIEYPSSKPRTAYSEREELQTV